ncbi:glycosyl hydrolase-related protein [Paenibacillus thalictri]|uniref:DUF5054 domain-containing protein n=1 Tax=Paenibacillus thalictri TaxID=2527873 RepID=A0A4Q9DGR5_9BACL|nr:glycosyl hydrolase-related protein [Paenibacillus thalictri]TBL71439.1 DUF5054 domain-containing protein [Paenibacillus thalictri]
MSEPLQKIFVVFKTHFDIGFTGWVSDVVQRYRTEMLKDVIDICEQTKQNPEHEKYVWTMSAWPLLQSLEGGGEEDRNKALDFIKDGQLIWHKLPYTTHTEFCGLEEWIRGMYVSKGLTDKFGYDPIDAKMTDVPGHTWIVPSLLKKAGVKILHLGCNPASTPPDVPPVFYWEGPDGERLLTFYSKGSYGTGILPPEDWRHPVWLAMIQTSDNHGPHDASVIDEMKASIAASGLNAELHIGSLGDFAEALLATNPELPVIRGDMADSWIHGVGTAPREVSRVRELRSRIAAVESALALSVISGEQRDIRAAKQNIDASYEHSLLFGEHTWGMDCKTFLFPRTYDKTSFQQDKSSERYMQMEHSWQEQRDYLDKAEAYLEEAARLLGGAPDTGETAGALAGGEAAAAAEAEATAVASSGAHGGAVDAAEAQASVAARLAGADAAAAAPEIAAGNAETASGLTAAVAKGAGAGKRLLVHNVLGWARDAEVLIEAAHLPRPGEVLADAVSGEALQLIPCELGAHAMVRGVPALGYKTLIYTSANPAAPSPVIGQTAANGSLRGYMTDTEAVLENEYLIVKVDRMSGLLSSLFDKRLNKEWVERQSDYGFGQFQYDIYSNEEITRYIKKYAYRYYDWGVHDYGKTGYPEEQKRLSFGTRLTGIRFEQDGRGVRIECEAATSDASTTEYGNASGVAWSVTLGAEAYVDLELRLIGKEETPKAESGSIVFPLKLERPQYRINKLGSVVDPCTDLIPSSSTLLNCCEQFVDISNGFAGLAVIPLDTPLFFIGKNGMWDFEHNYKPEKPELHFNLFNNWWGTNFPQWLGGDLRYRFRLVPHEGDWVQGDVWKTAHETMAPAAVIPAYGNGAQEAGAELLPKGLDGMAVTALKPAEDGDGIILRLRECIGEKRDIAVHLPAHVRSVTATDLLERDTLELDTTVESGSGITSVSFRTRPFEVHTLRIR